MRVIVDANVAIAAAASRGLCDAVLELCLKQHRLVLARDGIRATVKGDDTMQKKQTLTIDDEVYDGLREVVGPRRISRFVEDLVRPHVVGRDMHDGYRAMAADRKRESDALAWAEVTCEDVSHEAS